MLYDNLKDILRHTNSLGFIEFAKIVGNEKSTAIESIATDKTVIMFGKLKDKVSELEGHTIGLARMGVLNGYLNFPAFTGDNSNITITTQTRNGNEVPAELAFVSGNGHKAYYRFMSREIIEEQVKTPLFKGANYDVEYSPTKKNINDLVYFSNILSGFEPTFSVSTKDETLWFSIGNGPTDRSTIPFAVNVKGTLSTAWRWPLAQVLSILKLMENSAKCTMYFSNHGLLKITIDSGLGVYDYYVPARS